MTASGRVTASTLTKGYKIKVEPYQDKLIHTRRTRDALTATVLDKRTVPAGRYERKSRYVIVTDLGETVPVGGSQTFTLVASPAELAGTGPDAAASVPTDPAELYREYQYERARVLAGDQPAPTRDDMRPRAEVFRGRKLRVAAGKGSWGTIGLFVNGVQVGTVSGSTPAKLNEDAERLRADVIAADERRVSDPDAHPEHWYTGAVPLPAVMVAYAKQVAEQNARDRAALAMTVCDDPAHVPGAIGCPAHVTSCNGIPADVSGVRTEPAHNGTGFGEIGLELRARLADAFPGQVGTLVDGEADPYLRGNIRRFCIQQVTVSGHNATVIHYEGRRPLTGALPYIAVMVDGQLVDGAGDINAGQPSGELTRFLAWKIGEAVRALPATSSGVDEHDDCTGCGVGMGEPHAEVDGAPCPNDPDPVATLADAMGAVAELIGQHAADAPGPVDTGALVAAARAAGNVPAGLPFVADLPEGWPVAPVRIEATQVAKILRRDFLPAWFPGVKFSVRTETGSMYVGAHVRWTDGPADTLVSLVANMWQGKFFNGMDDSTSYRGAVLHVDADGKATAYDLPGLSVSTHRDVSDKAIDDASALFTHVPLSQIAAHSGYRDPFGRPWYGGSVRDCARWLAQYGVDRSVRERRTSDTTGCRIDRCRLTVGHRWPALHRDDFGRAFLATTGDPGPDGNGGGGPDDGPAGPDVSGPGFQTWDDVRACILDGRPDPAAASDPQVADDATDAATQESAPGDGETSGSVPVGSVADAPEAPPATDDEPQEGDEPADWYTLPVDAYTPQLESDPDAEITVTHTHQDGTILEGSRKGDGVYEIAQQHRFTYRRSVGIFIMGSRDKFADLGNLDKLGAALREAGHTVAFDLDDVWRPAAVREEARADRVSDRVERLSERASRRFAEGQQRLHAARSIGDRIPFGQPILVGHHSERGHRRAIERIDANYRAGFAAYDYAEHLAGRADGASANERAKQGSRAIMRRIETLEADNRRLQRQLDKLTASDQSRYRRLLLLEIERNAEDIAFQHAKLGERAASGVFVPWSREHFQPGDHAKTAFGWREVARVNAKSVSVRARFEWNTRDDIAPVKWDEIFGRRRDGMQWDTPNGEPWPVADAVKVGTWNNLVRDAGRAHPGDSDQLRQAGRVFAATRIVLGLPSSALSDEVEAFGEPSDKLAKRARAIAMHDVYQRLTAGETFDQVAATVAPIRDTVPRWTMPTDTTAEDVLPANLVAGDFVVGVWDGFATMRTLSRAIVGPVTAAPKPYHRHEGGSWVTVEVDGEEHDVRSHRWFSAHLTGAR